MDDKSLYAAILGLTDPWGVDKVELRLADGEVHVWVALPPDTRWVCPDCLAGAPSTIIASANGVTWTRVSIGRSCTPGSRG
jgi:hypothetical protein